MEFQLGTEKTLGEVISGIRNFLEGQNFCFKTGTLDGKLLTEEDGPRAIPSTGRLDVTAVSALEEEYSNLQLTADFFVLLRQAILESNSQVLEELSQEFPALQGALETILGLGFHKGFGLFSQETGEKCRTFLREKSLEVFAGYDRIIQTFLLEMDTIARGLGAPKDLWTSLCNTGKDIAGRLEQVPVHLSLGKDKAAMDLILELINHLESSTYFLEMLRRFRLDFFSLIDEAVSLHSQMNPFMTEITQALDRKDYVLVGDLLEYEVAPLLTKLSDLPGVA